MADKLSERLKRIRETGLVRPGSSMPIHGQTRLGKTAAATSAATPSKAARKLREEGWREVAPLVFERNATRSLAFPDFIEAAPFLLRKLEPVAMPSTIDFAPVPRGGLGFIDTETTGLSTGAGTTVFAFGIGKLEGSDFSLTQIFLADFPGEPDFLMRARTLLEGIDYLVSYNGKSFDVPLLRSRFIMNRMKFPELGHIDLLTTARRLWGRAAGGANLPLIERHVLGREREGDVPGSEAPERYMRFLRSAEIGEVLPVLDHHRSDILSLPSIMIAADRVFRGMRFRAEPDAVKLSLIKKTLGRPGWEDGLRAETEGGDDVAARIFIKLLKREKRWDEALELIDALPASSHILIEGAMILETKKRDFSLALSRCRRALDIEMGAEEREDILRRMERLERRLGGSDR